MDEPIIGIDLGTTFSLVAYVDERGPQIVRDENGDGRVPSVIGVSAAAAGEAPKLTIGWEARNHAVENPRATIYSIKRLIGRSIEEIREELPFLAYAVQPGPRQTVQVEIGGRAYTPEQISSAILRELRDRAERFLGKPVRKAVITVPAYFDDAQRQATRDAGAAAGLEVVRIINEPTAAALAYGIGLRGKRRSDGATERRRTESAVALPQPHCHESVDDSAGEATQNPKSKTQNAELVAVYDLGGGTFDISILRIEDGVFHVLATAGDTHLGGDDFDRRLIQLIQSEVAARFGVSIDSPATRQALRSLAEGVKIRLTDETRASIELDIGQGRIYRREITREEFGSLTADLVERSIELIRRAVRDARLSRDEIDNVVLVGGSTRMPIVRRRVAEEFGRPAYTALNPDEVVALGAAIQAALLGNVRAGGGTGASSGSPAEGSTRPLDLLLLDVTPLSLGIETLGGAVGKLILRNTTIPCRATEMFTTFVDGQTAIKVNVLQGERELARDCRSLGEFELRGIPPMPAGIPKVEVEFLIDANGILSVAARELRSGREATIQIVPNRGLTREEVERIKRESEQFGKEDYAAHRRIDLLNQVEFDTQKAEQMLKKLGDRVATQERQRVQRDIDSLRQLAQSTSDLDQLYEALVSFGRSTVPLAELGIAEALRSGR